MKHEGTLVGISLSIFCGEVSRHFSGRHEESCPYKDGEDAPLRHPDVATVLVPHLSPQILWCRRHGS